MYIQRGRFSAFLSRRVVWFRIRSSNGMPTGFLARIGREFETK